MDLEFHIIARTTRFPDSGTSCIYLKIDHWNDFSFVTMFSVLIFDEEGIQHPLPDVKIGFVGQTGETNTYSKLDSPFKILPEGFFSLGTGVDYYKELREKVSDEFRDAYLTCLKDLVFNQDLLTTIEGEDVLTTSLLRSVSIHKVRDQFLSVLQGNVLLTDFKFNFSLPKSEAFAEFDLNFNVNANSTPSTNIHALIGRNGVGKTTIIKSMVGALVSFDESESFFYQDNLFGKAKLVENFFSGVVLVAFSAFDPFKPPANIDEGRALELTYIGLTDEVDGEVKLSKSDLQLSEDFFVALSECLSDPKRTSRWLSAIQTLESDENFSEMELSDLARIDKDKLRLFAERKFSKMSSGHAIVALAITRLVSVIKEKSLVLFDEPESHLHPPLLSALIRCLSQMLYEQNAVAIIATHSPVVLQEVPKSCVWKVYRERLASSWERPNLETFGENVGILTREVFGLEVVKSGFHTVLKSAVDRGGSYEEILAVFGGQLGLEAKGILKSMIIHREMPAGEV